MVGAGLVGTGLVGAGLVGTGFICAGLVGTGFVGVGLVGVGFTGEGTGADAEIGVLIKNKAKMMSLFRYDNKSVVDKLC